MNRWEQFFETDQRVLDTPSSHCAAYASKLFQENGCGLILDCGCGNGRDTVVLEQHGLAVIGADEAGSCLLQARRHRGLSRLARADARRLPFANGLFDGVYCFGLLHEYTAADAEASVSQTVSEMHRVLRRGGYLVLAVLAGDAAAGMPHVRLFTQAMMDHCAAGFQVAEKMSYYDVGCTGTNDYRIWRMALIK